MTIRDERRGCGDKRGLGHNTSHPVFLCILHDATMLMLPEIVVFLLCIFPNHFPNVTKIKFLPAFPQKVRDRVTLHILMISNVY